jgi:hypothetical protein
MTFCNLCGQEGGHTSYCPAYVPDELSYYVDFDMERMREALHGHRTTMPEGMKHEEFREWMKEQAAKLTNKPVVLICSETMPTPYDTLMLGKRIHERLGTEYRVVIQKPRAPGDNRITFDLEETWMSQALRELEEPPRFRPCPVIYDELYELQSFWDSLEWRKPEAWQGKPVIPQPQPVGKVSDKVLGLLNRAKK